MEKLLKAILGAIESDPEDIQAYEDLYNMAKSVQDEESTRKVGTKYLVTLADACERAIQGNGVLDDESLSKVFQVHKKSLFASAPYWFDSYMQALEWDRPPAEKFYIPRRATLHRLVNAIQKLTDDELDELFLSMPVRVGKTSMLMFYCTWLIGRDSERSNLYSAYSDVITNAFYNGCLEVINDPYTYKWHEIFPTAKIASTNAKSETLNIDRNKRYPSLTCRSLYGTLNGACDCNGVLISDDLIGGIEEALNKDRMMSAWSKVDNNLLTRAKEGAKLLWCGTRWSIIDPAGIRMNLVLNDEQFKGRRVEVINTPALDENDESNFKYAYGVGFSTEHYRQKRASFERNDDMASWLAQYMGEPIERSGALFEPGDMRFFNGVLPDESTLVRKFMAIDPAFGGGDYTAGPICYQYDDGSIYIPDVVYSNGDKRITQPNIVEKVMKYGVHALQIEANRSTMSYKEEVEERLKQKGYRLNITTKVAPNNKSKEARIFDKAPEIREFIFLEEGKRSKEYSAFMQNVYSFKLTARNVHDDSVDSLAAAADMVSRGSRQVEVFHRPF